MQLIKTNYEGWMKDMNSGAVLNVDNAKLSAYKKKKHTLEEQNRSIQRLDKIEEDINFIKNALKIILDSK